MKNKIHEINRGLSALFIACIYYCVFQLQIYWDMNLRKKYNVEKYRLTEQISQIHQIIKTISYFTTTFDQAAIIDVACIIIYWFFSMNCFMYRINV